MTSTSGSIYLCVKQFNARLGDELSLKIGDKIEVLADDSEYNDGWFMGRNLLTNEVGLYPKTFTQLLHIPKNSSTLLRSRSRRVASSTSLNKLTDGVANISVASDSPPTPPQKDLKSSEAEDENNIKKNGTIPQTVLDINKALGEIVDQQKSTNSLSRQPSFKQPQSQEKQQLMSSSNNNNQSHEDNKSILSTAHELDPKDVLTWTPMQVSSYFAIILGFDMDVAGNFARHKISGQILLQLDLAHLKELDIDSFGTRFEIFKEIEKLRKISTNKKDYTFPNNGGEYSDSFVNNPIANSTPTTSVAEDSGYENTKHASKSMSSEYSNSYTRNGTADTNSKSSSMFTASAHLELDRSPTSPTSSMHQRKLSQSLENLSISNTPKKDKRKSIAVSTPSQSFMSPRKAPEPPTVSPYDKTYKYNERAAAGLGILERPTSSIYENSISSPDNKGHSKTHSGMGQGTHRRHSSLFSFLSTTEDWDLNDTPKSKKNIPESDFPGKISNQTPYNSSTNNDNTVATGNSMIDTNTIELDDVAISPKKSKSVSYKDLPKSNEDKKSSNDSNTTVSRLKTLRTTSTQNFRNLTTSKKSKTSAFQEGIRHITPDEAIKTANYSGWMSKKSSSNIGWRSRYFTLHGTRLSYFTSLKDKRERGLIDVTAHKVLPVGTDESNSNDKYVAMYASSTGFGRYCFKVIPPAPGFKKGLTFTQPKTHYFAVETQEEMRGWLKAIMTATIDIDDTVPVVSSCQTPTVSLLKAQELLSKAREETRLRDEQLRSQGYLRDGFEYEKARQSVLLGDNSVDLEDSEPIDLGLGLEDVFSSEESSPVVQEKTKVKPQLQLDTVAVNSNISSRAPTTPNVSTHSMGGSLNGGFASPYLLASGLLSPRSGGPTSSGAVSPAANSSQSKIDYFAQPTGETTPKSTLSTSNGRTPSGNNVTRKKSEKMMAYSSDGSGNHSFVIKCKK